MRRLSKFAASLAALAAITAGGATLALGAPQTARHATVSQSARSHATTLRAASRESASSERDNPGESNTAEPDSDAAAQAAACQKAGINPNADNVQYDDQTGVCSLDTGSNSQQ